MQSNHKQIKEKIKSLESSILENPAGDDKNTIYAHWMLGRQYTHLANWENPIVNYHKAIKYGSLGLRVVNRCPSQK